MLKRAWFRGFFPIVLATLASACPAAGDDPSAPSEPQHMELTVADAVTLALENNRELIDARLGRELDKIALEEVEEEFAPRARATIGVPLSVRSRRTGDGRSSVSDIGATFDSSITVKIPTGGETVFAWDSSRATSEEVPYRTSLKFSFTQPLLRGAGIAVSTASLENARRREESSVLAFKSVVMRLVTEVVRSYWNLVTVARRLEISAHSLQRAKELLEVNRLLIRTGRMAERDIIQTEANVAERELALTEAQNSLEAARLGLLTTLNIDSRTQIQPTEQPTIDPLSLDVARGMELALEHRPDYRRALLNLDNLRTNLVVAENERLWDLSLTASTTFGGAGESFSGSLTDIDGSDHEVGLDLRIPLGDPRPQREYLRADIALKQANNGLHALLQTIDIDVRNAVRDVEVNFKRIELARQAQELAEQKLDVEREKLNLGLSTNFQLVAFEDDLVNVQSREVDATISYLNALARLDQTLGTTLQTWRVDVSRTAQ